MHLRRRQRRLTRTGRLGEHLSPRERAILRLETLEARVAPAVSITLDHQPQWVFQGPAPITGGQSQGIKVAGSPNVTNDVIGAVTAIAIRRPSGPTDNK